MTTPYAPSFGQWLTAMSLMVVVVLAVDFVLKLIFRIPFDGWQAVEMVVFCLVASNVGMCWQFKGLPFKRGQK